MSPSLNNEIVALTDDVRKLDDFYREFYMNSCDENYDLVNDDTAESTHTNNNDNEDNVHNIDDELKRHGDFPCVMNVDEIHERLHIMVKKHLHVNLDDDILSIISEFVVEAWEWDSNSDDFNVSSDGQVISNETERASNWDSWAHTDPFPETGISELRFRIDKKRNNRGWLGVGVIRKSFVEKCTKLDGGYSVYNKHAIFIDPTWHSKEDHFNLKGLDVEKQMSISEGDEITIVVNNNTKEILFSE
eukprot:UN23653